jgi:hypothetical protein
MACRSLVRNLGVGGALLAAPADFRRWRPCNARDLWKVLPQRIAKPAGAASSFPLEVAGKFEESFLLAMRRHRREIRSPEPLFQPRKCLHLHREIELVGAGVESSFIRFRVTRAIIVVLNAEVCGFHAFQ